MDYETVTDIARTLRGVATDIVNDVPGEDNERLNRLHDLRDATQSLRYGIIADLHDGIYDACRTTLIDDVKDELKAAEAFVEGVIMCDVQLALKD